VNSNAVKTSMVNIGISNAADADISARPNFDFSNTKIPAVTSFLMLGGGSLIAFVVLAVLQSPALVMNDSVRMIMQQSTYWTLAFVLVLSYPHFVMSYKFAYTQGFRFIWQNAWALILFPAMMLGLLALSATTWNSPLEKSWLPLLSENLGKVGVPVDLNLEHYSYTGQAVFSVLLILQAVMSGYHFCMQSFGITLLCAEKQGYRFSKLHKSLLRANVYALWFVNLTSGLTAFTAFNTQSFAYYPYHVPPVLFTVSCALFFLSAVSLAMYTYVFASSKSRLPLNATLVILALWVWLQPFCQPFGYQAWVVPMAHGVQYMYVAIHVESNNLHHAHRDKSSSDSTFFSRFLSHARNRHLLLFAFALLAVFVGYWLFVGVPVSLDHSMLFRGACPNFFFLSAFMFLTTHHYMVDTILWKKGSKLRDAFPKAI
jgi:hypothetical protein